MDIHKKNSIEENVDSEFLDTSSQTFPLTILMSFLVVFTTIIILWWAKNRHKSARRGECLLLCGVSNSGKTLLFSRLTMGLAKRTLTSMAVNHGSMILENPSSDRPSKKIHIIDIPGNLRIRQRDFNINKSSAKAIIFVIDSTTINEESKDVSDYLYDILREKTFRQQRLPLLIFCNKQDINNDNETIQTIRNLLENELTMKRKTRASSVGVHQGKGESNDDIGQIGKETFEFNDIKDIQIEFVDGSALGTEKKSFTKQYDDNEEEEDIDSGGDETDADSGTNLNKMTRFAKHKKTKKSIGENATSWEELKEPINEEDKRKEDKRLEKKRKRQLKKICFRCRNPGHSMNECTTEISDKEKKKREIKTGICYKCGSTEHRLKQCTIKGDSFAYATCFICGKQGHWSRLCPDNPNGLYPNGGCCNECGSIQHFKRDCPTLLKKQGIDDQQLPCLTSTTNNIDDNVELVIEKPIKTKKSLKRLKLVKF